MKVILVYERTSKAKLIFVAQYVYNATPQRRIGRF